MDFLRDRWHRTALCHYLEALPPTERQTFWIVSALAIVFGLVFSLLAHASVGAPPADPWFDLPRDVTRLAFAGEFP